MGGGMGRCRHRPLRCEIETLYNNAHPPHVGCFCLGMGRVDVGIDPYDVEYKFHECARRLQNRTISCAGNTVVAADIRRMKIDAPHGLPYPVCRGGRLCPPTKS